MCDRFIIINTIVIINIIIFIMNIFLDVLGQNFHKLNLNILFTACFNFTYESDNNNLNELEHSLQPLFY